MACATILPTVRSTKHMARLVPFRVCDCFGHEKVSRVYDAFSLFPEDDVDSAPNSFPREGWELGAPSIWCSG